MARFELTLLGSCSVRLDGKPVRGFASDKARLLLAYLAVEGVRPIARERLAEIFWPEHPPDSARACLRNALSNLRSLLTSNPSGICILDSDREVVQLAPEADCWVDAVAFEDEIQQAESALASSADLPTAMQHYQAAVDLYRGSFLEGFSLKDSPQFDDWCYFMRERLLRRASAALSRLADHYESCLELERALACARRSCELEPWQEEAHRRLMRLFAVSGQRGAAMEQYEACRRFLAEELDMQPSVQTTRLYDQIRHEKIAPAAREAAGRLPVYLTPFIGRQAELGEIANHLHDPDCRLLTLLGPGGCGKTRLAVGTAAREKDRFADGVCFVPLVAAEKREVVVSAILHALGVTSPFPDLTQILLDYLQPREMLLVLDNYEQLLLEGAEVLPEIITRAPRVRLLVTSRERLHLPSEWIYNVAAMCLPSTAEESRAREFDAVRLFCATARRQRGSSPADEELKDVVRICRLVGGMPLAIEIAASWTRALSCAEIASEIERSLAFLHSDQRELQARHRSVQAVFETTWKMLSEQEQAVFRKLSVFRGGFTRPAAEQVAGADLRSLTALLDRCLVSRRPDGRYDLHELLRQFAADKLAQVAQEEEQALVGHSQFFQALCAGMDLIGTERTACFARAEADLDNLRAAWRRSAERGDYPALESLFGILLAFLGQKDRSVECLALTEETLRLPPNPPPEPFQAELLMLIGKNPMSHQKDPVAARECLEQSLEISRRLGLRAIYAENLMTLGNLQYPEDYLQAVETYQQSIVIWQELGSGRRLAYAYRWLGMMWYASGFLMRSDACLQKSLEFSRLSQYTTQEVTNLFLLGNVKVVQGDLALAREVCCQLELVIARDGIPGEENLGLCIRGLIAWREGQFDEARRYLLTAMQVLQEHADQGDTDCFWLIVHYHLLLCQVLEACGEYGEMWSQAAQAVEGFHRMGLIPQYGDPGVEPLGWLGRAETHLGDFTLARQHLLQFIRDCLAEHYTDWALFGLYHYAELLVKKEDSAERRQQALALLTLVLNHPRLEGVDYHPAIFGKPALPTIAEAAAQIEKGLTTEEAAAARERGRRLVLDEVVRNL